MIKGVFLALGIMVVLCLIPIVHFIGIPFGPFIGGYYGIAHAYPSPGNAGRRALGFGISLGMVMGTIFVAAALIVTAASDFSPAWLLWLLAVIFTFYYGSMSGLGAWYSGLRSIR